MFFKLIFLLIILFLFIIKKNNIEPFIDCIQKYYNHHVKIFMKDNINEYEGILMKSDNDNFHIHLEGENYPIEKELVKKIIFNDCPNDNLYFDVVTIDEKKKIALPCDKPLPEFLIKYDFEDNDWGSENYKLSESYCPIKSNYECNSDIYKNDCSTNPNMIQINETIESCNTTDSTPCEGTKFENYMLHGGVLDTESEYTHPLPRNNCGCIDTQQINTLDPDSKKNAIEEAIQQKMKKTCFGYGENCKGFAYEFLSYDSQYEQHVNHGDPIDYTAYYYQNCHLKNQQNYSENLDKKTFVKKYENDNFNYTICSQ